MPGTGIEPARLAAHAPKASASTNFAIRAYLYYTTKIHLCLQFLSLYAILDGMKNQKEPSFMYGFLDESGEPGAAKHPNDYLVISLVIFDSYEKMVESSKLVDMARRKMHLSDNYEFHRSKNTARVKEEFLELITEMEFSFVTIAMRKKRTKGAANYRVLGENLVAETRRDFLPIRIIMDSNPSLYKELSIQTKVPKSRRNIYIKQAKSHTDNMLQVADYVANISAQWVKCRAHSEKSYGKIKQKCRGFIRL